MAGRAGSEFNASSIAVEAGVSSPTIANWLSTLMASYIVYKLPPYFTNLPKRLTKSPKIYFYDTGLMCYLLGIQTPEQLDTHPLRGAVFENMVLSELLKAQVNKGLSPRNIYYYRENAGREIDFVEEKPSGLSLYEVKAAATFRPEFLKT